MGRWRPVGLTEGLWREVAAPPPLAFSERSPSPWLRHREDQRLIPVVSRRWRDRPTACPSPIEPEAKNKHARGNRRPLVIRSCRRGQRSDDHTSVLPTLKLPSYPVFCFKQVNIILYITKPLSLRRIS